MSNSKNIIGIDLGTTNSLVCVYRENGCQLIPNKYGNFLTPSVVSIDEKNNIYTGQIAKERLVSHPDLSIASFKRYMGTDKQIKLGDKTFSPEQLSAFVLQDLVADAEAFLGQKVDEAIISVPAYFNDDSRNATKSAGQIAGLNVERVINEPSAAALAARTLHDKNDCMLLVIDMGGGTLDVSLVECFDNIVSVLAVNGDNFLGGDDFDVCLAKHFCKVNNINYFDLSTESRNIILKNAEACKIALSVQEMIIMTINTPQIQGSLTLNRAGFIKICNELFSRISIPIQKVFADAGIDKSEVDDIVLVGGGCKIAVVAKFISHLFGRRALSLGESDQIVALGVGVYAGIKSRNEDIKQLLLTDICPFSLGIGIHNPMGNDLLFSTLIERNTALPVSRASIYQPYNNTQTKMTIEVYQGENMLVKDNLHLGTLKVEFPNIEDKNVQVRLTYDLNGILQVEAHILATGQVLSKTILSKTAKNLSEEEIQRKLTEFEKFKKKDKFDEQVQFLIDSAESLYAQTTGETRELLMSLLKNFVIGIGNTNSIKRKMMLMKRFWTDINSIKTHVNYDLFENMSDDYFSWYEDFDENELED